ncbi:aspartate/glutamate racemase family protein [Thalassobaculum sp.]|uniref:aspartate/glutamate racemase family protein n=1 Tax=Thalassobaculum sp. TaxID=2022740 RepID=UPI003B5C365F
MTYSENAPAASLRSGDGRQRTIGIVACSAEGAALCYRTICARAPALLGPHAHPEVALHGASLADYVVALEAGDLTGVGAIMLRSAEKLAAAGAEFLICPDNTIHAAMDHVRPRSPLPWLHIAEVVAAEARRRGVRRTALLGTRWLVDSAVYPEALAAEDIEFLRPEEDEKDEVARIIMDELVNDIQVPGSVTYLQGLIERLRDRGCDTVILGCTELPLVLSDKNSALPTLDSTRLLADAALRHAMG